MVRLWTVAHILSVTIILQSLPTMIVNVIHQQADETMPILSGAFSLLKLFRVCWVGGFIDLEERVKYKEDDSS